MPVANDPAPAEVTALADGARLRLELRGRWHLSQPRPKLARIIAGHAPTQVRLQMAEVGDWDSSLLLFVTEVQRWATARRVELDLTGLPESVQQLLAKWTEGQRKATPRPREDGILTRIGLAATDAWVKTRTILNFVGECVLSAMRVARQPLRFRWRDCLDEMQQCGAMALPIVSLISLLVGLIMAYQAAVQLRQFGADIYVADLVGLAVVREMGPMMAAIILAGRTGAAFAATIANMKVGEEIDALETFGIPAIDFLVLPRLVALGLMMPLLALYANLLGILGGMMVAKSILEIPPAAYWVETQSIIDLSDISTGLMKATAFGLLIGLSGCLRGLEAERSAAGVGRAATSAVVTAILLIIISDALFAVAFNILGL